MSNSAKRNLPLKLELNSLAITEILQITFHALCEVVVRQDLAALFFHGWRQVLYKMKIIMKMENHLI